MKITILEEPNFIKTATVEQEETTITIGPSIFVSRNGKKDIIIRKFYPQHKGNWGVRVPGGFTRIVKIIAEESGEVLREYEGV